MMDESRARYSVTIYVAAPGTPRGEGQTSMAGHVYYTISAGHEQLSYGFAPATPGATSGPGKVFDNDLQRYERPLYARTMEISQEQYQKLLNFGDNPDLHGFNMEYQGAANSCVDFTWAALNHAGLHRTSILGMPSTRFEGNLKPLDNRDAIRSIRAPFPDSVLNREQHHPMPKRTLRQRLISEEDLQPQERAPDRRSPSGDAAFDEVFYALQSHDEQALEQALTRMMASPSALAMQEQARAMLEAQQLEQAQALAQAAELNPELAMAAAAELETRRSPVRVMTLMDPRAQGAPMDDGGGGDGGGGAG